MESKEVVFVTGAGGYIGSHTVLLLLENGYDVVAIDNFANCANDGNKSIALNRVEMLTGKKVQFYQSDILDVDMMDKIFMRHKINCVIHFAAMKSVEESMSNPLLYYQNNVVGTLNLLQVMKKHNVFNLVMSSTCCVYGNPTFLPITENHSTGNVTNVYGRTKYIIEEMLKDASKSDEKWNIILLRYFNPVGAHSSGLIGEDPTKEFSNLMPFIGKVALGKAPYISVFGNDYDTPDGTGVRDYIHIMDLAEGHVKALEKLKYCHLKCKPYNLGTGKGYTVLQLIEAFEKICNVRIPYKIVGRRKGDVETMYADSALASKELDFHPKHFLEDMCKSFWKWQQMNPNGYLGN